MPKKQKANWVSFQEIKAKITMEMLLSHYGIRDSFKVSGTNLVGCCPIHKGTNPRQFSVNTEKNIFNCFGDCGGGGNVIDFVAKMERATIRKAALLIKQWFPEKASVPKEFSATAENKQELSREKKREGSNTSVNPPLTFQLKSLDLDHPFFTERGITSETIKHFGLGYCSKGMMAGRVVIPIHNSAGELVAYCGRAITKEQALEEKYKLPPKFVKMAEVYNLNRQTPDINSLILVESYFSVFKLYQSGVNQVVALMGSNLSEAQEQLIVNLLGSNGHVLLLFDSDEAGQRCTQHCLGQLSSQLFVKALDVKKMLKTEKPHQANGEDLAQIFSPYFAL